MPHHIEVKLGSGDFGSVNIGSQNALFIVLRPGHELTKRADDAASTTDQYILGCREPFRRITGRMSTAARDKFLMPNRIGVKIRFATRLMTSRKKSHGER